MRAGEELDFVTKLSRDGDLVRLSVNQARDTSTGVVPIEMGVSQGGMLIVVVAADHGSDPGAAHHHRRNILIWPQVTAITVNLHEQIGRCFLDMGFVHGKTPDVGSQAQFSPICSAFNMCLTQYIGFADERYGWYWPAKLRWVPRSLIRSELSLGTSHAIETHGISCPATKEHSGLGRSRC